MPRNVLLPIILLFCVVGSYAMTNSIYGIVMMLVMGVVGWLMEENGFPIAPAILGLVLGEMLEQNFMTSMIKSDGVLRGVFRAADRGRSRRRDRARLGGDALARHQPFDHPDRANRVTEGGVVVQAGSRYPTRGTAGSTSAAKVATTSPRCRERQPRTGPKCRAAKVRKNAHAPGQECGRPRHHGRHGAVN